QPGHRAGPRPGWRGAGDAPVPPARTGRRPGRWRVKLRARTTKVGKVRFTSHRDAARIWERALRKVQLPVAATAGFTPRPKISFGLALPTGAESIAEYVDIELREDVTAADLDIATLPRRLSAALPVGFDVLVVAERDPGAGSLQE